MHGTTVGLFVTRRAPNGFRVTFDGTYTSTAPKDGPWLSAGKDKTATEWTEFRQGGSKGFAVASLDVLLGHEFGENGTFGFYVGGGLGVAIPLGTITTFDAAGANFDQKSPTGETVKKIPPVVPNIIFKVGPTVNVGGKATLSFDVGLQTGFFVGVTAAYRM